MECFYKIMLSKRNRTEKYHAHIYANNTHTLGRTLGELKIFIDGGEARGGYG